MHFRAYLPLLLQLVAASHPLDSPVIAGPCSICCGKFLTYLQYYYFVDRIGVEPIFHSYTSSNPMSRIYVAKRPRS